MSLIRRLRIGARLTVGYGAVVAVFLLVVVSAYFSQAKLEQAERWNAHTYKVMDAGAEMAQAMVNMETGARGFLLSNQNGHLEPWEKGIASFASAWKRAKDLTADNPKQQSRLDVMKTQHEDFKRIAESLIAKRRTLDGSMEAMNALLKDFSVGLDKKAMDSFRSVDAEFLQEESALLEQRSAAAEQARSLNRAVMVGGSLAAIAIAVLLITLVTRSVVQPIREAVTTANAVASGDLRWNIRVEGEDEPADLLRSLEAMTRSLSEVVRGVRTGADSLATASSQIAAGNADLSQRTEEQASNLQQTAATMEQLTATVHSNTETAQQASQLAGQASAVAEAGGGVVQRVVTTMQDISASSSRITDIIGVIDGIAFQTNILALNAAVEAARAGEQGRGFAVVASEVRALAQRSAGAAKEIKSLIAASVEKVEAGSGLVSEAGKTMGDIVTQVQRVTDLINEMSAATREQNQGFQQVGAAVVQLDQVTQQNAALVEESAAASDSLKQQAAQLVGAVSRFTLDRA